MPFSVREGINVFLAGFIPTENLRFREEELNFKLSVDALLDPNNTEGKNKDLYRYPGMTKTMTGKGDSTNKFILHVEEGSFTESEIVVMLGENGTGKTTFIRMLAGLLKSDEQSAALEAGDEALADSLGVPQMNVSYKPQMISPKFQGTVRQLLHKKIRDAYIHPQFSTDVMKPMSMEVLMDNGVQNLSGGELQRTAIVLCLGTPANIYLIDEPSAYLDSEQRIAASKVIKNFIMHAKKTAFVVEHDFIMATYLADKVIVYDGEPGIETTAHSPQSLVNGMNFFLRMLNITFRRDPTNHRPRINKHDSVKDQEQKKDGNFFYMDD
jgi:ATP-binding cassette subfamily E protein 1